MLSSAEYRIFEKQSRSGTGDDAGHGQHACTLIVLRRGKEKMGVWAKTVSEFENRVLVLSSLCPVTLLPTHCT